MRTQRREGSAERRVLIGMVVSTPFVARIAAKWTPEGLFASSWANRIAKWCVDHYARYDKAPGKGIQATYEAWAEDSQDKEGIEGIGSLLASISGEYAKLKKEINVEHLADIAAGHFDRVMAERRLDKAQQWLEAGDAAKAIEAMSGTKPINLGASQWVDPYRDMQGLKEAFERKSDPIVTFDGDLGEFFGSSLERDGFIGVQGQAKRGKSWVLQAISYRAMQQQRRVAMFQVGDLSMDQTRLRLAIRSAKRPFDKGTIKIPTGMIRSRRQIQVQYEEKTYKNQLTYERAERAMLREIGEGEESLFRLEVHPNSSITIMDIAHRLQEWDREGWLADVVICDYADILAPVYPKEDKRDQIHTTWKLMRRLSQEMHCLVVTATQADAESYNSDLQRRKNFSNDRRKYDEVTGMFGINMSDKEKSEGRSRLNWLQLRSGAFTETKCVHVAGCLAIADPWMVSSW